MGRASRDKGARRERQTVERFKALGVHCEKVPLSGAARYRGNGSDIDVYLLGREACPIVAEVKARGDGEGFKTLERWMGDAEMLVLQRDRADPLVVLPWHTVARIAEALCAGGARNTSGARLAAISTRPEPDDTGGSDGTTQTDGPGTGVAAGGARAA